MLALEMADNWLAGKWLPATPGNPLYGDSPQDVYGVTLAVGQTVKMVGVITAINTNDPHCQDIKVTPSYPNNQLFIPSVTGDAGNPFLPVTNPQLSDTRSFHPWQLIVGG